LRYARGKKTKVRKSGTRSAWGCKKALKEDIESIPTEKESGRGGGTSEAFSRKKKKRSRRRRRRDEAPLQTKMSPAMELLCKLRGASGEGEMKSPESRRPPRVSEG